MKVKQSDLNKLARKIAKANEALWDAIGYIGEVLNDDLYIEISSDYKEHNDLLKKLAVSYDRLNKKFDGFADASLHNRDFDDFDELARRIDEVLENE